MHEGLYEQVVTRAVEDAIGRLTGLEARTAPLDDGDGPTYLARLVAAEVFRVLATVRKIDEQARIANVLLRGLREAAGLPADESLEVASPEKLLFAVHQDGTPENRPETPLSISSLLAKPGKPNLGLELIREIETADRVDALVGFIRWTGLRQLLPAIRSRASSSRPFRLIATTYTGATEAAAVKELAAIPGVEVKVSYDGRRTRLHAKAWLFHRETGFSTAYIGSANLSGSGLGMGLEWVLKVTEQDLKHVVDAFRGAFESLWEDPEFERFDPGADLERLEKALSLARGGPAVSPLPTSFFFDLRPYPFQQQILDALEERRGALQETRSLIVAATGSGKTMIAAFDYARQPSRPRLLFVAHRKEILEQAISAFRHIVRDGSFGELLTGDSAPEQGEHLFATVQSFSRGSWLERRGGDYWPYVVIDECHHLPAPSYREIMGRLRPRILLGLTATPERMDGQSLLPDFGNRIAAEIRLWHALEKQLVAPFEYFGLHDETDLRNAAWTRGAYALKDLDGIYTGNDRRAALVAEQFGKLRGNPGEARALGFCVSVAHAEFMARKFQGYGIPSLAVHGGSPDAMRASAPEKLRTREVNVLFTCDLYNEGVDLPLVDTLLLLRPTSSSTVFLQQIGRGLRLAEGKESCLILDFIGNHRREFRFDSLLGALTGIPRGKLREAVDAGFPALPPGCHLRLDRVSREIVLENLRNAIGGGVVKLARELASMEGTVSLAGFLEETGREPDDVYGPGWTSVRRRAGKLAGAAPAGEEDLSKKLAFLLHIDERERLELYRDVLAGERALPVDPLDAKRLLMLGYQLLSDTDDTFDHEEVLRRFSKFPEVKREACELCDALLARAHPGSTQLLAAGWPLALHRKYARREILTAVGHWTESKKPQSREGVVRLREAKTEILLVTLDKTSRGFSPTTRYEDYAISSTSFHWQSQSLTSESSEAGRRYIDQARNGWTFLVFVRPTVEDAFAALGPVRYESHRGSRPMSIVWHLETPIPAELVQLYTTLLAA